MKNNCCFAFFMTVHPPENESGLSSQLRQKSACLCFEWRKKFSFRQFRRRRTCRTIEKLLCIVSVDRFKDHTRPIIIPLRSQKISPCFTDIAEIPINFRKISHRLRRAAFGERFDNSKRPPVICSACLNFPISR